MKRITFIIALLFFNTWSALACSCVGDSLIKDPIGYAFKKANAVFSGRLVSAEFRKGFSNWLMEEDIQRKGKRFDYEVWVLTFETEQSWKGEKAAKITLATDRTKTDFGIETFSSCDYRFEVGERYLVYAFLKEGNLKTGYCTRTTKLSLAEKDLRRLGKGKTPKDTISVSQQ